MKKLLTLVAGVAALLMTTACGNKQQAEMNDTPTPKALVLYYSQTGATQAVAEEIANALGADIEAIEVEEPYSGDYQATIERCMKERMDTIIPQIKPLKADLADYDVVFVGYPIWFGTYARPIYGLIDAYDFEGKKVVPFCTFGSGGIEASAADLKAALPKAEVAEGYGVRNARIADMPAEVNYYLISNGYVEGEVEALPEYSEQQPVTEEETAIFEAACGDYQFPLGTPVTVGKRSTSGSTDYKYTVNSKGMDGTDVEATIYVTVAEGSKPAFTRVVR